jgi:hypothetical protein
VAISKNAGYWKKQWRVYRRLMVMVLIVTIGSQSTFFVVGRVARHPLVGVNSCDLSIGLSISLFRALDEDLAAERHCCGSGECSRYLVGKAWRRVEREENVEGSESRRVEEQRERGW